MLKIFQCILNDVKYAMSCGCGDPAGLCVAFHMFFTFGHALWNCASAGCLMDVSGLVPGLGTGEK